MSARRILSWLLGGGALLLVLAAAAVAYLHQRDGGGGGALPLVDGPPAAANAEQITRGAYLARAGNCIGCHSQPGGTPYAGGAGLNTPFGAIYPGNLTPHRDTGLGGWSSEAFWRALHHGRSRDGRLLAPAFPYTNTTLVSRDDSDALFAYLQSLPPVDQAQTPSTLRFPYNSQLALAVWRALYFRPASFEPQPAQSAEWNRGAYLVGGLGHCSACHAERNPLGATAGPFALGGGLIPLQGWHAPALNAPDQAGVAGWDIAQVVSLLKTGVSAEATVMGPMAEVVQQSTQHLSETDLRAMAVFLQSLPQQAPQRPLAQAAAAPVSSSRTAGRGAALYTQHCVQCHGDTGQGAPGAYPRLAGNRAVTMEPAANLVRVLLAGGFPPSTQGNPRPYGMPPFATVMGNEEVAEVLNYIRSAWGNTGRPVTALEVQQHRDAASP